MLHATPCAKETNVSSMNSSKENTLAIIPRPRSRSEFVNSSAELLEPNQLNHVDPHSDEIHPLNSNVCGVRKAKKTPQNCFDDSKSWTGTNTLPVLSFQRDQEN